MRMRLLLEFVLIQTSVKGTHCRSAGLQHLPKLQVICLHALLRLDELGDVLGLRPHSCVSVRERDHEALP
jgi:hypothetical protein